MELHEEQEKREEEEQEVAVGAAVNSEETARLTEGWSAAEAEAKADEDDRVRGSFLGLAWGDVFGCPVEGWRSGAIQQVPPVAPFSKNKKNNIIIIINNNTNFMCIK
jgi:hypothetical protein